MCGLRSLRVVLNNDGSYAFKNADETVTQQQTVIQYKKEHCATLLEIELNDELLSDSVSYYTLSFNMGSSLENRFDKKHMEYKITADSEPDYFADGVIYYQLPDTLTVFSCLCVQVEAHTLDENGLLASTVKSATFELEFEKSVDGEPESIPGSANGLIAEFHQALNAMNETVDEADELFEKVNTAFDNGELNGATFYPSVSADGVLSWHNDAGFENPQPVNITGPEGETGPQGLQGVAGENAKINGCDTVEIVAGENISLNQQGNVITINTVNCIPLVTSLPQNANEGDTVIYLPVMNTVTATDAGRTAMFDYSWIDNFEPNEELYSFKVYMYTDSTKNDYMVFDFVADSTSIYIQLTDNKLCDYQECWICYEDGKFVFSLEDSSYSYQNELGEVLYATLEQPIESIKLPHDIYSVEITGEIPFTWFHLNPELYVYRGGKWYAVYDR